MKKSQTKRLHLIFNKQAVYLSIKFRALIWSNINKFLRTKSAEEVTKINYSWINLLKIKNVKNSDIKRLTLATTTGWVAYSIIDNIIDKNTDQNLLAVANVLARQSFTSFRKCEKQFAIQNNKSDVDLSSNIFDQVDEANHIESLYHHATDKKAMRYKLCLEQTYKKSVGHALGPIMLAHYFCGKVQEFHTREFFKNYIIARQLHDDGLDWKEDIAEINTTIPLLLLMRSMGKENIINLLLPLNKISKKTESIYKNQCLPKIYKLINSHLNKAELHLNALGEASEILLLLNKLKINT